MNKAMTAGLLSAFVCPGAGHFYLKKYNFGTLISAVSLTGLAYLLYQAVTRAREISEQILSGAIPLDISIITQMVTEPPANAQYVALATWVFFLGWAIGIFDAYRLGRAIDKKESKATVKAL